MENVDEKEDISKKNIEVSKIIDEIGSLDENDVNKEDVDAKKHQGSTDFNNDAAIVENINQNPLDHLVDSSGHGFESNLNSVCEGEANIAMYEDFEKKCLASLKGDSMRKNELFPSSAFNENEVTEKSEKNENSDDRRDSALITGSETLIKKLKQSIGKSSEFESEGRFHVPDFSSDDSYSHDDLCLDKNIDSICQNLKYNINIKKGLEQSMFRPGVEFHNVVKYPSSENARYSSKEPLCQLKHERYGSNELGTVKKKCVNQNVPNSFPAVRVQGVELPNHSIRKTVSNKHSFDQSDEKVIESCRKATIHSKNKISHDKPPFYFTFSDSVKMSVMESQERDQIRSSCPQKKSRFRSGLIVFNADQIDAMDRVKCVEELTSMKEKLKYHCEAASELSRAISVMEEKIAVKANLQERNEVKQTNQHQRIDSEKYYSINSFVTFEDSL